MRSVRLGEGEGRLVHYHGDLGTFYTFPGHNDRARQASTGHGWAGQDRTGHLICLPLSVML